MSHTILAATTGADISSSFVVAQKSAGLGGLVGDNFPVQVTADNLAGVETAHLEVLSGSTWQDVQNADGDVATLVAAGATGATTLEIYAPGTYRVDKDATAGACAIYLHTPTNP